MNRKGEAIEQEAQSASCQQSGIYHHAHDFETAATVTATIAHAIADDVGIDVSEAERLIGGAVDPEALDRVFRPRKGGPQRSDGQITFSVRGHQVTFYGSGQVVVVPPR
jgi:lipoate-protein ligase B